MRIEIGILDAVILPYVRILLIFKRNSDVLYYYPGLRPPLLEKKGNFPRSGSMLPWPEILIGREFLHPDNKTFASDFLLP